MQYLGITNSQNNILISQGPVILCDPYSPYSVLNDIKYESINSKLDRRYLIPDSNRYQKS